MVSCTTCRTGSDGKAAIWDMIAGMIMREMIIREGDIIFTFTGLTAEEPEESESGS